MKKTMTALIALLVCLAPLFAGEEDFLTINTNAKTKTDVYLPLKNQKCSIGWAVESAMVIASVWNEGDYSAEIYKNTKALLSSQDFKDDYIYGSVLTAVTNLHYGLACIYYSRYDDEYENIVGWDFLALYALDDGRFMCVKILGDLEE